MKVSELFRDVVTTGGGTPVQTCACGTTHYATGDHASYDEGELEKLEEEAKTNPKMIPSSNDCVGFASFGGLTFVYECEDCPVMEIYERFIWAERRRIIEYLKRRSVAELEDAKDNEELVRSLTSTPPPAGEKE